MAYPPLGAPDLRSPARPRSQATARGLPRVVFFALFGGQIGVLHDHAPQVRIVIRSFVLAAKYRQAPDLGFPRRADAGSGRRIPRLRKWKLRGLAESYRTAVSCPETPHFPSWDRESCRTPSSRTKGNRSSTDDDRQCGPLFPSGQESGLKSRSRTARPSIRERIVGRKSFAYCATLDARTTLASARPPARPRLSRPVPIRASKAGSRPGNQGVAANLTAENMGRCQFRRRDYALGTQTDPNDLLRGPSPHFRPPN